VLTECSFITGSFSTPCQPGGPGVYDLCCGVGFDQVLWIDQHVAGCGQHPYAAPGLHRDYPPAPGCRWRFAAKTIFGVVRGTPPPVFASNAWCWVPSRHGCPLAEARDLLNRCRLFSRPDERANAAGFFPLARPGRPGVASCRLNSFRSSFRQSPNPLADRQRKGPRAGLASARLQLSAQRYKPTAARQRCPIAPTRSEPPGFWPDRPCVLDLRHARTWRKAVALELRLVSVRRCTRLIASDEVAAGECAFARVALSRSPRSEVVLTSEPSLATACARGRWKGRLYSIPPASRSGTKRRAAATRLHGVTARAPILGAPVRPVACASAASPACQPTSGRGGMEQRRRVPTSTPAAGLPCQWNADDCKARFLNRVDQGSHELVALQSQVVASERHDPRNRDRSLRDAMPVRPRRAGQIRACRCASPC